MNPKSWEKWWESYSYFILHYAKLAKKGEVEVFSVGSELASTEIFQTRWINLIQAVRKIYSGKVTYSANWDHFEEVSFASELDFLGVSGYYELAGTKEPTREEMLQNWQKFMKPLQRWSKTYEKDLVFMEIGYASQDGCASKPWNYFLSEEVDLAEQSLCFEVLFETWEDIPCFQGIYVYNWWGKGGEEDRDYTLRGKPAAELLKKWFLKLSKIAKKIQDELK